MKLHFALMAEVASGQPFKVWWCYTQCIISWYLIDDLEHLQQLTAEGWLPLEIPLKTHSLSFCSSCVLNRQLFPLNFTFHISVMIKVDLILQVTHCLCLLYTVSLEPWLQHFHILTSPRANIVTVNRCWYDRCLNIAQKLELGRRVKALWAAAYIV